MVAESERNVVEFQSKTLRLNVRLEETRKRTEDLTERIPIMKRDVAYLKQQVESNNGNEELLSALEGQVRKKADEVKKTEEEP
eukprot:UN07223